MKRYTCAAAIALLVLAPWRQAPLAGTAAYTIEPLGTTSDSLVPAETGINASGQVSGYVNGPLGTKAVRYTDGVGWEYLPGLDWGSVATGINVHGDLSGYHTVAGHTIAFRYRDGTGVEDIGIMPDGTTMLGFGINDAGDVVGYGDTAGKFLGWRASPGLPAVTLPTLGGSFAMACGINNNGQIVETSTLAHGSQHAARLEADGVTLVDAGSFDGPTGLSSACAIDELGHIGGYAQANGGAIYRAFRLDPAGILAVDGTLPHTFANVESISGGASAGWYTSSVDGQQHALLYTDAAGAVDLNDKIDASSGWFLSVIKGVNASGVMVGDGRLNGAPGVFRLRPGVVDKTPPTITSLSASPSSISPVNGLMVAVTVAVSATDDSGATPSCGLSSITGPGTSGVDYSVTGSLAGQVKAVGGRTYVFGVTCSDAAGNSSSKSTNVVVPPDTTAPVISSVTASPASIWPPRGQMVGVTIAVTASDDSGVTTCNLAGISGPGTPGVDYLVTGTFTGSVKAVGGRTYPFTVLCVDYSGNASTASVDVVVPPDTTPPTITALSASPATIWPPDNKMVSVGVSVSATDDVDLSPACALTSIAGGEAGDAAISGPLSGSVRAVHGSVYVLTVTCADQAGNKASATTTVVVSKDAAGSSALRKTRPVALARAEAEGRDTHEGRDAHRAGDAHGGRDGRSRQQGLTSRQDADGAVPDPQPNGHPAGA